MERYVMYICECNDGPHIETRQAADGDWVAAEDALAVEAKLSAAQAEIAALREAARSAKDGAK